MDYLDGTDFKSCLHKKSAYRIHCSFQMTRRLNYYKLLLYLLYPDTSLHVVVCFLNVSPRTDKKADGTYI